MFPMNVKAKEINLKAQVPEPFESIMSRIQEVATKTGYKAWAVGGFVRDLITGVPVDDLDILVDGPGDNPAIAFGSLLEQSGVGEVKATYKEFGVCHLLIDGEKVELVMPRSEEYEADSRNPVNVQHTTIEQDAARRDFTINTLMMDLGTREIHDPLKRGVDDLKKDILASANPQVDKMFIDDPLRMMRAIRFVVAKGVTMEPELMEGIRRNIDAFDKVEPQRIRDELEKILTVPKEPSKAFRLMLETGLLRKILPELQDTTESQETPPGHLNESSFDHIMRVLDNMPPKLVGRLAALLHDVGKSPYTKDKEGNPIRTEETKVLENKAGEKIEQTIAHFYQHHEVGADMARAILKRLHFPHQMVDNIGELVYNHMRPYNYKPPLDDYKVRKFIFDLGETLDQVMEIARADQEGSKHPDYVKNTHDNLKLLDEKIKTMPRGEIFTDLLLNGAEIRKLFNANQGYTGEIGETDPWGWLKDTLEWERDIQLKRPTITKDEMIKMMESFIKSKYPKVFQRRKA